MTQSFFKYIGNVLSDTYLYSRTPHALPTTDGLFGWVPFLETCNDIDKNKNENSIDNYRTLVMFSHNILRALSQNRTFVKYAGVQNFRPVQEFKDTRRKVEHQDERVPS